MREPTFLDERDIGDPAIFILDCDNTLFDNDRLKSDLDSRLRSVQGAEVVEQFWGVYEEVRVLTGTVDFPLTLERMRPFVREEASRKQLQAAVMEYRFADCLYPDSLATLDYLRTIGLPAIVSDGDTVYQPMKITGSGLAAAVDWRVLIFVHKEDHLEDIFLRWPAPFYIMVDDKQRILAATKSRFPDRFVTVHVRQGHYGNEPDSLLPAPDITIDSIGDLRKYRREHFTSHLRSGLGG